MQAIIDIVTKAIRADLEALGAPLESIEVHTDGSPEDVGRDDIYMIINIGPNSILDDLPFTIEGKFFSAVDSFYSLAGKRVKDVVDKHLAELGLDYRWNETAKNLRVLIINKDGRQITVGGRITEIYQAIQQDFGLNPQLATA